MKLLQFLLYMSVMLLFSCNAVQTSGTSSDIDIELIGVAGFDAAAVPNATVTLSDRSDSSTVATALTDASGTYRFSGLNNGSYYITALYVNEETADSVRGVLEHDIPVGVEDTTVIVDTLWMVKPGAIEGWVNLDGGTGSVQIYVSGTSADANILGSGPFCIYPVWPDSNYTLVYSCDGFSTNMISGITVLSGDTLEVAPQYLTANDVPQKLKAVYDTTANTVTLSWNRMKRDDVTGYIVTRTDDPMSTKPPVELNEYLLADTFYVDSLKPELFSQVSEDSLLTFHYQVLGKTAKNKTGSSKEVVVNATITRDSLAEKKFLSLTPDTGGVVLQGLTTTKISWQYRGLIKNVELKLSTDGGNYFFPISGPIKNDGFYVWPRVNNVESDQCQMKIIDASDPTNSTVSEFFSIEMIAGEEMLLNGDFSSGLYGWPQSIIHDDSLIDASITAEEGQMKASVISCDPKNVWKVRAYQKPLVPLYKNCTYEIRVKARASVPVDIYFEFFTLPTYSERGRYFGHTSVSVPTEWVDTTLIFNPIEYGEFANEPISPEALFSINFGGAPADVWVDNVSLRVVGVE